MGEGDHISPSDRGTAPPTGFPEAFTNSVRGMVLGLLLGDIRDSGAQTLRGGAMSHQICWTLDSLVRYRLYSRARERSQSGFSSSFDIPAPVDHIREGLLRWGRLVRGWPAHDRLDGWLIDVPALADARHGDVLDDWRADLETGLRLSMGDDRRATGLARALPISAAAVLACPDRMAGWCSASVGLTHGHPEAWSTAAMLGVLAGGHLAEVFRSGPWVRLDPFVGARWLMQELPSHPLLDRLMPALADTAHWSSKALAALSPDDSAASVLGGSLYLFQHTRTGRPAEIRALAGNTGAPGEVAALTSALVGLDQGTKWLDVNELSRHELAWTADALARDFCLTLWSPPPYEGEMDVLDEMSRRYPWQILPPKLPETPAF